MKNDDDGDRMIRKKFFISLQTGNCQDHDKKLQFFGFCDFSNEI